MGNYSAHIEEKYSEVESCMRARVSADDIARMRKAFEFACEAHKDQKRKTGEPYILHPIAVALILAKELELGVDPVISAFLHDVVEDTPHTIDEIREMFGDNVAFLVKAVTKAEKKKYEHSKQVDNYKQILTSVEFDMRALLVKLADRLHNMRTLDSMPPEKQMKIAGETIYFYAPLANRLGLYHVMSELENLSFRFRCPRDFATISKQIEELKSEEAPVLKSFTDKIVRVLREEGITVRTELRYRSAYSVYRKMQANDCDFNHVEGKHYVRIIYDASSPVKEKRISLDIYGYLTDEGAFTERPNSVTNFINVPKTNGYQSFHVKLFNEQASTYEEIHISSERMVRNSRLGCAADRREDNLDVWLNKFRDVLKDLSMHCDVISFMDGVTSTFFYNDVMVLTPEGKLVILPKGSTAIDFAYDIHRQIGEHAVCARINGKLSSIKTKLEKGDCVEIVTDENAEPQDWLDHVLTYKAKRSIRSYMARKETLPMTRCKCCNPLPGDEVIGYRETDGVLTVHKRNCNVIIRLASQYGDSLEKVDFCENPKFLYPVKVRIRAIDRKHLLIDMIKCISEDLDLSIIRLKTDTVDSLVECTVQYYVHSVRELQNAIESILKIENVEEAQCIGVE